MDSKLLRKDGTLRGVKAEAMTDGTWDTKEYRVTGWNMYSSKTSRSDDYYLFVEVDNQTQFGITLSKNALGRILIEAASAED